MKRIVFVWMCGGDSSRSNYATHFGHVASTPLIRMNLACVISAMTRASVVFPLPGGPEKITTANDGFNGAAQKFAGAKDVFLADKFLQRARSHPCGERRSAVRTFNIFLLLEQIVHRGITARTF